jgi:hypothetical protein
MCAHVQGRGRLWQPRCYDHVLRRDEAFDRTCDYVLANPVRAGFVENTDDYRWCAAVDPIPE